MSAAQRVLITGAAGNLGAKLAAALSDRRLTLLDRAGGPDIDVADLSRWDASWVERFAGIDAVVHLAADPIAYHDWPQLIEPNLDATLNVFAAAARAGVRRVVFASSNHVMGGYQDVPDVPITEDLPPKPGLRYTADGAQRFSGPYAATKLFGERLGRHYAEARGMEVVAVRIGWVWRGTNEPNDLPSERGDWFRKMWLSNRDFTHLIERCLDADLPEKFLIVNGMSANTGMRWDLTRAGSVFGYRPQDDVEWVA